MSKFTPGPWEWYWNINSEGEAECGIFHRKKAGMVYSVARCHRYQNREQWESDARLIAAAPEMYELLRDFYLDDEWHKERREIITRIDGEES